MMPTRSESPFFLKFHHPLFRSLQHIMFTLSWSCFNSKNPWKQVLLMLISLIILLIKYHWTLTVNASKAQTFLCPRRVLLLFCDSCFFCGYAKIDIKPNSSSNLNINKQDQLHLVLRNGKKHPHSSFWQFPDIQTSFFSFVNKSNSQHLLPCSLPLKVSRETFRKKTAKS